MQFLFLFAFVILCLLLGFDSFGICLVRKDSGGGRATMKVYAGVMRQFLRMVGGIALAVLCARNVKFRNSRMQCRRAASRKTVGSFPFLSRFPHFQDSNIGNPEAGGKQKPSLSPRWQTWWGTASRRLLSRNRCKGCKKEIIKLQGRWQFFCCNKIANHQASLQHMHRSFGRQDWGSNCAISLHHYLSRFSVPCPALLRCWQGGGFLRIFCKWNPQSWEDTATALDAAGVQI